MNKKSGTKTVLAMCVALALIVASLLVELGFNINAHAQTALAAGISSFTTYPTPGGDPWGTAFDSSGRVWVALPGCDPSPSCSNSSAPGKLALFDPTTQNWVVTVSLPAGYGQPLFVAVDQSGKVWFTMPVTNAIGMYDPNSTSVTQWAVPTASVGPWDLAIDAQGTVWFTEFYSNQIGSFTPATQTFHAITTSSANSHPYGITIDASGNIWFTENTDSVARIGEYTTQGSLLEYKIRNSSTAGTGLTPHLITTDAAGNVWWSEGWVAAIGKLNVAAAVPGTNSGVTEYAYNPACSGCGAHTSGIRADSQGLIWLDDSLQNNFGSFPVGGGSFSFYAAGGHPHDGLNVDKQNRIWFDEEFNNALALAIPGSSSATATSTPANTPTPTFAPTNTPTSTSTPVSGTILAHDTFQRDNQALWGTASDGQSWGGDANSVNAFSISGNTGLVTSAGTTTYSVVLGPTATDSEAYTTSSISSFNSTNFGDVLRWTDGNNWYKAYLDGSNLVIQKKVGGSASVLATTPFAATAGVSYTIHFSVVGSTLTANAWPASSSEPTGWMVTASDSSLASGYAGMRFLTQTATLTVTSFQADVPGGSATPTATPTSTPTPTPTSTPTPTPTSTPTPTPTSTPTPTPTSTPTPTPTSTSTSGTTIAQDTFQRANQSPWGTASDGHTWGGDANNNGSFSIAGNVGLASNAGSTTYSAVLGSTATNAEVYATLSISTFNSTNFGVVLRWTDGNNWYKAYLDGSNLIIQKKVGGVASIMASTPFAATAGVAYTIHFRAVGSTLTANVWASSGSESSGWMVSTSDSSLSSGYCGIRFLTQTGTLTVTAFLAKQV